jgi:regulator of cell morphogenesis and NO signaling
MEAVLHRPVGDLVAAHPSWAGVFESMGIDFCCHGAVPLYDACADAGLDPDDVVARLEAHETESPVDGACPVLVGRPVPEIVEHLLSVHHPRLRADLAHLADLMARVRGVHGERHPELHEAEHLFAALHSELDAHLLHEEAETFPELLDLAAGREPAALHGERITDPLRTVLVEHDLAGDLLERLGTTLDGYRVPSDACASYTALLHGLAAMAADLHVHIHEENNILFPAVLTGPGSAPSASRAP